MSQNQNRVLGRAARARARARQIPYTAALHELRWMQQLVDEGTCENWEEADAHVCDPRNQLLCGICGWSVGMVCPECAKGCGCEIGCSGWRHREWAAESAWDEDDEDRLVDCEECGGTLDTVTGYGCACAA